MYCQILYLLEMVGYRVEEKLRWVREVRYLTFTLVLFLLGYMANSVAQQSDIAKYFRGSSDKNETVRLSSKIDEKDIEEFPDFHDTRNEFTGSVESMEIRGLVKPDREIALSTNRFARISEIYFKEGDYFKQGEVLVRFDCLQQRAEEKAAEAEAVAREVVFKNNQELLKYNAVGSLELELSKSQYEKSMADLNVLKIRNWECVIKAPWNGRVTEIEANKLEVVEPGREIMKILDDSSLEIEMIVPSKWLAWLQPGMNFVIAIDETGKSYPSYIARIGARVDPVSQTLRVFASFKDKVPDDVLAGMSGRAIISAPN